MSVDGPTLFARFAYPPHALGYCGPDDDGSLFEYAATGVVDRGLREAARAFEGAWPYLELIAAANRIDDPLDRRVVEAYWIGNGLLGAVGVRALAASVDLRFRARAGAQWDHVTAALGGAHPDHGFHVFHVYPWAGLLRGGPATGAALHVLDRCRIRTGVVEAVTGDTAVVATYPLEYDGAVLGIGPRTIETVRTARDGVRLASRCSPGDVVALHWDWVCAVLTPTQAAGLHARTRTHLRTVNRRGAPSLA